MKLISDPNQTSLVDRSLDAVWHPCTQMKHHESLPLIAITKGKDAWLFDDKENALLDCISSWWTNLLTFVCKPVNLSTTPLNSLSFIRSDRFVIIWQLNSKFFLWCYSVQYSSWVTQITNKTFISLYKYWYCTSTRTWIIYPTIF